MSTHYTWGVNYNTSTACAIERKGFHSTVGESCDVILRPRWLRLAPPLRINVGYNLLDVVRLNWFETFLSGLLHADDRRRRKR